MVRPRTIGRVHVQKYELDPNPDEPETHSTGYTLRTSDLGGGTIEITVHSADDARLGQVRVHLEGHGDPFYGRWSKSDDRFCYCSALEVLASARGKGLGKLLKLAARRVSYESNSRGLTGLIDPSNEPSMRTNLSIGCRFVVDLRGVRVGPRVFWWSKRRLSR